MFGSHLSIAGGMHNALHEAKKLGMPCVQVFTKNQRQWQCKPLGDEQVRDWQQARKATGIKLIVSHDSYLINLASVDPDIRGKSIALFREELVRCEALDIPYLVTHPGAHLGEGEEKGLAQVAAALDQLHRDLPGLKTITCLEITAGQGTSLGYRFEHLARIRELVAEPERLAVCLDSAHLLAAGYDLTSAAGVRATLEECKSVLGRNMVKVWHINDSKTPRGSRVDRHAHIGHGHIPLEAFAAIVNTAGFSKTPKILETPKERAEDGRPWDLHNLETLANLEEKRSRG